ncbi:MAG: hypothetical protein ABFD54_00690 [Armatimonadota bacterium]|nr:hypothetical protein [bacterium]
MRIILLIMALLSLVILAGCGSSNGDGGGGQQNSVNIQNSQVTPKNVNVDVGDSVRWINLDSIPHQVISGTLLESGSPTTIHPIVISGSGFSPQVSQINFGETIRLSNTRTVSMNVNVVNDAGQVVEVLSIPQGGQIDYQFPSAGAFSLKDTSGLLLTATVIVFGTPNPNGIFQSVTLGTGDTFTVQFDTPNTYNYFVLNANNPNQSFMTGTVTVQ